MEETNGSGSNNNDNRQTEATSNLASFSLWKPSTWNKLKRSNTMNITESKHVLNEMNDRKLEEVEREMFKSVKSPHERFHVKIKYDYPMTSLVDIWTVAVNKHLNNDKIPIVLIHGFMSGIAPWRSSIDALCESRALYAFDLIGFGRSSRPKFSTDPIIAENQFVDAIEEWRKEMRLDRFILLGHSFGGYLSTAYALKYPQHIHGLILEDAWGFPEATKEQFSNQLALCKDIAVFGYAIFKCKIFPNQNYSLLNEEELNYYYINYANTYNPKSGEEAFRTISNFGFSKNPMLQRFHRMDPNIPIWFLYGSNSWIKEIDAHKAISLRPNHAKSFLKIIDDAGHRIHLDKPNEFNEYIKSVLAQIDDMFKQ